jgi:excisionase family DNA binding protein
MTTLPDKELLRPDEVAAYYSVNVRTVLGWVATGKLEAIKIAGGVLSIPRTAINKIESPAID